MRIKYNLLFCVLICLDPAKLEQAAKTNPKIKKIVEKLGPLMSMFAGAGGANGASGGADEENPGDDDLD